MNRKTLNAFIILILIPITMLFGIYVLDDRKYYFISMLIILYTLLPFFLMFEKKGPKLREVMLIAVMIALAVAGRSAFFMLPQFKPVVAIVIISGFCLGSQSGFLIGAMSGFISNFFFGQGPWTVYQMFAFGLIGFLAGLFKNSKTLNTNINKKALCLYGFIATFFIYGGIVNIQPSLMSGHVMNWKATMAVYVSAVPFDLMHSIATMIFLYFIAEPMIEKIDRIRIKYGLNGLSH
ncbi:MAG: ECF transporter S component [Candidatus Epulonipiscioides saccharophilum]|nr:MAG: ECF transporter S component [Epulopiscium sp. AS2M-Bin001]